MDSTEVSRDESLIFRPPRGHRFVFVAFMMFGAVFGLSGLASDGDIAAGILMAVFGALVAGIGIASYRAYVRVDGDVLIARFVRTRRIAFSTIGAVRVALHGRVGNLCAVVDRAGGRRVWLIALERRNSVKNRTIIDDRVDALRRIIRL